MSRFEDGDKVRYIGPPSAEIAQGEVGDVLMVVDTDGGAYVTFPSSGAGYWTAEQQENLELVDSDELC